MTTSESDRYGTRFVVGIDLGTTNSAVCYVDLARDRLLRQFPIPQLIAPGETVERMVLPSFCLLPAPGQYPEGALDLPWSRGRDYAVGMFARAEAARVPGRVVVSAKSWLAHAGVDRTRPILPWGEDLGEQNVSPVEVSRRYLLHIREAWNHVFGEERDESGNACLLEHQQVVLTVPASFDEAARRLTLEAAQQAGFEHVELLEEPLAAFYAWLAAHEDDWQEVLDRDGAVLVVDVGGGTTDFTIVHYDGSGVLRRTAVGEHILLGGDNMDVALARRFEEQWGVRLDSREWARLCGLCRDAKERLLLPDAPPEVPLALTRSGRKVVGGVLRGELDGEEVREFLLGGFFPETSVGSPAPPRGSGIRRMGLPYAQDPAIPHHLLAFLRAANGGAPDDTAAGPLRVQAVLFNGGALYPEVFRERLRRILAAWYGYESPLPELEHADLSLAVSRGAAYHGLVRRGRGVRVQGGAPRAYYLETAAGGGGNVLVCILPRGAVEGDVIETPGTFLLQTNRPVRFTAFSSATRLGDRAGDRVTDRTEMTPLPPLCTTIRYGRRDVERSVLVRIRARLNIVGALDIWCEVEGEDRRYPLSFDLRAVVGTDAKPAVSGSRSGGGVDTVTVDAGTVERALSVLNQAFQSDGAMKSVYRDLASVLEIPREEWNAHLLRTFTDALFEMGDAARVTPAREARWLNLLGFCLRPGCGVAGDDWRVRSAWKVWCAGAKHPNKPGVQVEWWILWRRIAGGLRAGQQEQVAAPLLKELIPRNDASRLGPSPRLRHAAAEMWRCLGALERLPPARKLAIVRALCSRLDKLAPHHWWALGRTAARKPLFAGPEYVIPAEKIRPLVEKMLDAAERRPKRQVLFAVTMACRLCGVRNLDLPEDIRSRAAAILERNHAPGEWLAALETEIEESAAFRTEAAADSLPLGLHLSE